MLEKSDPHADGPLISAGSPLENARAALILLHGRGGTAEDILGLYQHISTDGVCALAPQAAGNAWYPQSFMAPLDQNQPYLDSALQRIAAVINQAAVAGIPADRTALLGFSQGACLACEFVARNPQKYGAVMALTGGFIGPPGTQHRTTASLDGTPVFLGTSDPDPHVPVSRVEETRDLLTAMDAQVDFRSYPGMPHTINNEELDVCREMLQNLLK